MPMREDEARGPRTTESIATDIAIRLGFLALFAYWSLSIVAPFFAIVVWSVILAVALHPVQARTARLLGGRPALASVLVTLALLVLLIAPTLMLADSLVASVAAIRARVVTGNLLEAEELARIEGWPVVGPQLRAGLAYATENTRELLASYGQALLRAGETILFRVAAVTGGLIAFAASIVISGFLYGYGPALAEGGRRLAVRVVGPRGAAFVDLSGRTVRSVARGVIGIALVQAILFGIGLEVAGVPGAGLIALIALALGIVQLGLFLPVAGALLYSWSVQETQTALLLTLYLVPVMLLDNALRPFLLAKGLPTPVLVILIGLIGGTLSYGLIGVFLGPIVLAVFYDLVVEWVRLGDAELPPRVGGIE